jgi:hypothetical protein
MTRRDVWDAAPLPAVIIWSAAWLILGDAVIADPEGRLLVWAVVGLIVYTPSASNQRHDDDMSS